MHQPQTMKMGRLNSSTSSLCSCGTWTLLADYKKRIQAFWNQVPEETSPHLFGSQDQQLGVEQDQLPCGSKEPLLATVKRWKLTWFWHATHHNSLSKTFLQGTMEGGQYHGWQRKCWMGNIKEWTSLPILELLTRASYRKRLEGDLWGSSVMSPPLHSLWWPNWSRDWTEQKKTTTTTTQKRESTWFLSASGNALRVIIMHNNCGTGVQLAFVREKLHLSWPYT